MRVNHQSVEMRWVWFCEINDSYDINQIRNRFGRVREGSDFDIEPVQVWRQAIYISLIKYLAEVQGATKSLNYNFENNQFSECKLTEQLSFFLIF